MRQPSSNSIEEGIETDDDSSKKDDAPKAIATINWDKAKANFVGAELYDYDGDSVLRLYYDYTNLSDVPDSVFNVLRMELTQNGEELEYTETQAEEVEHLYGNDILSIHPNVTIRAFAEYYLEDESAVSVKIYDYYEEEDPVEFELDLAKLPGKPDKEFEIKKIADPSRTDGKESSGTYEGDLEISIDEPEFFEQDGEKAVRVNFTFTNNSEEADNMQFLAYLAVYQDGIQLKEINPEDKKESDVNYYTDTEVGATVNTSICFALRTDSPIEVELYEFDEIVLGKAFNVE